MAGVFTWLGMGTYNPQATDSDAKNAHGDGGAYSRLDRLIDNDGPLPMPAPVPPIDKAARSFQVTDKTRLGGSGLFHGKE